MKVNELFRNINATTNLEDKQRYMTELIRLLVQHSFCEEEIVYPVYKAKLPHGTELYNTSLEEHQQMKNLMGELDGMKSSDEKFNTKCSQLEGIVLQHVKEEEEDFLVQLAKHTTDTELNDLARTFENSRSRAPLHPHPWAPTTRPFSTIAAAITRPFEQVADRMRSATSSTSVDCDRCSSKTT